MDPAFCVAAGRTYKIGPVGRNDIEANTVATPKNFSVIKAFSILKAFRADDGWLSCCELSRRANLPQASGHRLIQTMEDMGAVVRGKRGQYRPGLLLLSLSRGVPLLDLLRDASKPILTNLAVSFDLTTHLAILKNGMVTYIGKYCSATSFQLHTRVGTQLEAHSSGLGKVLLAGLNRDEFETFIIDGPLVALTPFTITSPFRLSEELEGVRNRGFATDDRESHVKTRCVAVPVKDSYGTTIAAISASDETNRMTASREVKIKPALFEAAAALQNALYRRQTPSENRLSMGGGGGAAKKPGSIQHCRKV
jgi:DNA-binding IclR family transcriptional regulator